MDRFSPFNVISAGIKIGVWDNSKFELGSTHEKFGVWTGPNIKAKITVQNQTV